MYNPTYKHWRLIWNQNNNEYSKEFPDFATLCEFAAGLTNGTKIRHEEVK